MLKNTGKYTLSFLAYFTIGCSIILMLGYTHHFLGTGFIFLQPYLIISLMLVYWYFKRSNKSKGILRVTLILASLIFLEYSVSSCLKNKSNCEDCSQELSLMSYNIFFKNKKPKSTFKLIKNQNPDILAMQELTPRMQNVFEQSVGKKYPYRKTYTLHGTHGIGLYSKYPILSCSYVRNSRNLPIAQVVKIDVKGTTTKIVNAHLASPGVAVENPDNFFPLYKENYQLREQQLEKINFAVYDDKKYPTMIMGDLNTMPYEPIMRNFRYEWADLLEETNVESSRNFPHASKTKPLTTLDYILLQGDVKGISSKVIQGGNSDHLAIFGKVKI